MNGLGLHRGESQKMTNRQAVVGDAVLFDGDMHLIVDTMQRWSREQEELVTLVIFENPKTKVTALLVDLRWSDVLNSFYMWGRALRKSDRTIVAELRDRGLLPARKTRTPGNPPAGGEHMNLYLTMFRNRPAQFWDAELASVRPGGDLSAEAVAAIADYTATFKQKLVDGYADPTFDDSVGEE